MRSGYGPERREHSAVAAGRPLAGRDSAAILQDRAADALLREEDDPFQWFVDLFVAEYAAESLVAPAAHPSGAASTVA